MANRTRAGSGGRDKDGRDSPLSVDNKLDLILNKFDNFVKEMESLKEEQREIVKSIDNMNETMNSINSKLNKQDNDIKMCSNKIVELTNENVKFKGIIKKLNMEKNDINQYLRKNCVDIVGIPWEKTENLLSILNSVSSAIGFQFNVNMVDNYHRIFSKNAESGTIPPIIIKFCSYRSKVEFLQCKKVKGILKLSDIGWANQEKLVYVNESMSPEIRKLFKEAKIKQKAGEFKYVWFRNGKIYTRKDNSSVVKVVNSLSELDV